VSTEPREGNGGERYEMSAVDHGGHYSVPAFCLPRKIP
jgi:hypothetical protein